MPRNGILWTTSDTRNRLKLQYLAPYQLSKAFSGNAAASLQTQYIRNRIWDLCEVQQPGPKAYTRAWNCIDVARVHGSWSAINSNSDAELDVYGGWEHKQDYWPFAHLICVSGWYKMYLDSLLFLLLEVRIFFFEIQIQWWCISNRKKSLSNIFLWKLLLRRKALVKV